MTTFTLVVELYVSGAWLDITKIDDETKVLRDGSLTITRGRSEQQDRVAPTEVRFTYLDNNGLLDGENPASPYYHLIGVGTPLRVTVDGDVRAVVEIVQWEPSWDDVDSVVMVQVVGAGMLRRIEDGRKPLKSPAYRALTGTVNDAQRVMYVPFEEESGATSVFLPYGQGQVWFTGNISFGAYTDSPATSRMFQFGGPAETENTHMFVRLPTWSNTAEQHLIVGTFRFPETELANGTVLWCMYFQGGTVDIVHLVYGTGGLLELQAFANGSLVGTVAAASDFSDVILDQESVLWLRCDQDGADVDFWIRGTNATTHMLSVTGTLLSRTLGTLWHITIGQTDCEGLAFGQLAIASSMDGLANYLDDLDTDADVVVTGARGYEHEHAGARIERMADEENIPITVVGDADDTSRLGPQGLESAPDMIYTAADTDLGILFETRDALELVYRTRVSLYNQSATALSYNHLSKGFRAVGSSDLRVTNSVTAQRDGGGSATYAIPDGDVLHWTTQDPPDGAGLRESEAQPDVAADPQLISQAAWRAHLGSWREKRVRQVTYELARPVFDADDRAAVRALDLGDVIEQDTTGAPPYLPYDPIRLMVQGSTEYVSRHLNTFTFNTTPADLFEVDVTDSGGSTIVAAVDADDTSLKLATSIGPEWSTVDEPYYVAVDGDAMKVTAMVTDTPAFIAAGTANHAVNASVTPGLPAGMTPDVGQLMLAFVAIRNSGSGVVNEHSSGWTTLCDVVDANVKVLYRYYVTGDSAPTFTFTNGVANADTSAQICAFSGVSHEFASGTKTDPDFTHQLNGSAQNIAYPALQVVRDGGVVVLCGWKQDDWTSVGPLGTAEIGEPDTTTGDDQGIVWDYLLYSAATNTAAGSWTVTGGVSAISRAIVFALRPLQTATVVRGIANTATSHAVGDAVHAWRPGVSGL